MTDESGGMIPNWLILTTILLTLAFVVNLSAMEADPGSPDVATEAVRMIRAAGRGVWSVVTSAWEAAR